MDALDTAKAVASVVAEKAEEALEKAVDKAEETIDKAVDKAGETYDKVALNTPQALKEQVRQPGEALPSLEDVFLRLTGKKLEDADKEAETK